MGYADNLLLVSGTLVGNTVVGQDVHASSATVLSTNTIDLGSPVRDIGEGDDETYLRVQVTVAGTVGTSVEFQAIATDAANLTGNVTVIGTTGPILTAALTVGARFACRINPRLASKGQRYLGMQAANVGAMAAISVVADFGDGIQDAQKIYPVGFSVA
jgi:hypothetical protein